MSRRFGPAHRNRQSAGSPQRSKQPTQHLAGPDRKQPQNQTSEYIRYGNQIHPLLSQPMSLIYPGAEGGEPAEQPEGEQPDRVP